jgi:predicted nucleic acid-binding protein
VDGKPAEIIKAAEQNKISILTSEEIVTEISQFLSLFCRNKPKTAL